MDRVSGIFMKKYVIPRVTEKEIKEMFMNEIPAINMVATGQRITELRQASGMSVRELQ